MDIDLKKIFGSVLTILGTVVVLYACAAFLSDGRTLLGFSVSKTESIVPFIVGLVFFMSGVSLIRQINDRTY
jgi:uncharacterized membrane protein